MTTKGAKSSYMRLYRATGNEIDMRRAHAKARTLALAWVRQKHPEQWERFLEEGYRLTGGERRPPGRPRKDG